MQNSVHGFHEMAPPIFTRMSHSENFADLWLAGTWF